MPKLKRSSEPVSKDDGKRFRARYFREPDSRPQSWRPIRTAARGHAVTLVYSSHDEQFNNAAAPKQYLQGNWRRR